MRHTNRAVGCNSCWVRPYMGIYGCPILFHYRSLQKPAVSPVFNGFLKRRIAMGIQAWISPSFQPSFPSKTGCFPCFCWFPGKKAGTHSVQPSFPSKPGCFPCVFAGFLEKHIRFHRHSLQNPASHGSPEKKSQWRTPAALPSAWPA